MEEKRGMSKKELSEEEFKKLDKPSYDLDKEEEQVKQDLLTSYRNIIDILKEYLDLKEEYYNIIALWIIGTYFHEDFPSYPFLFLNAMKGSGKTRSMNLITTLSKNGQLLNSLTEAVLFRTSGALAIDEFEGVNRKGNETLKELLNSAYKRGAVVKRMRQKKTQEGNEMVVEEFEVYRPIVLANIWGMDNVLGDRCITLILERSNVKKITDLMEIFREDEMVINTKELLNQCSLCRLCSLGKGYREWNTFVKNNYTYYTYNTNNTNNTNYTELFKTIKSMDLNGRELELSFPLLLLADLISPETLKITTLTLKDIFQGKKEEELVENSDISLYDFISQYPQENRFIFITDLTIKFKDFIQSDELWINTRWMGRALKRLNLFKEKKRIGRGSSVLLNIEKAIKMMKRFR